MQAWELEHLMFVRLALATWESARSFWPSMHALED